MATAGADPVFLDTNLLVYAKQSLSPFHSQAVVKLGDLVAAKHPL